MQSLDVLFLHYYKALSQKTAHYLSRINSNTKYSILLRRYVMADVGHEGITIPRKMDK
jgi:hypothetical protein